MVIRTRFELAKAQARAHILEGLIVALDNLDKVIALIRGSQTTDIARDSLMSNFSPKTTCSFAAASLASLVQPRTCFRALVIFVLETPFVYGK